MLNTIDRLGSLSRRSPSDFCQIQVAALTLAFSFVVLTGCDAVGESDPDPPSSPSAVTANGIDGAVELNWDAPGEGVDGYRVYRSTSEGFSISEESSPVADESSVSETAYEDTDVTNTETYYYRVTAVNEGGESESSSLADATPMANPPDRP